METMRIKTAAALYDINPRFLRTLCLRGTVKGVQVGGRWFVTPEAMDAVFKGAASPLLTCRPKLDAVKDKITLKAITEKYRTTEYLVMKDERLKPPQKLNGRWFFDRAEVERVLGSRVKR